MSTPTDGGPAYPSDALMIEGQTRDIVFEASQGMSLRDHFAGQALAGMNLVTLSQGLTSHPYHTFKDAARNAYLYADAMIEARSTPTPPKQA